jgi:hypothetical protein
VDDGRTDPPGRLGDSPSIGDEQRFVGRPSEFRQHRRGADHTLLQFLEEDRTVVRIEEGAEALFGGWRRRWRGPDR